MVSEQFTSSTWLGALVIPFQYGLVRDRPPACLSAIAGLSLGLAALLINLNFFAESTLLLGGKKNK
jgi:hypothetical protein